MHEPKKNENENGIMILPIMFDPCSISQFKNIILQNQPIPKSTSLTIYFTKWQVRNTLAIKLNANRGKHEKQYITNEKHWS